MADLKTTLQEKIPHWRAALQELLKHNAQTQISAVSMTQVIKGLRGVRAVLCDTSYVDPKEGLFIRGKPVLELVDRSGEEIFYLLCTGALPDANALTHLQKDISGRAEVPNYVWQIQDTLPDDTHPMTRLSTAMLSMQRESVFSSRYNAGMRRDEHWQATLEDSLNIIARLPVIAAGIYRSYLLGKPRIAANPDLGFSENFAHMLGLPDTDGWFQNFIRQFVVVHSDHEGANASVYTSRIVDSSLADLYYSISASMNSLAGPLHGLANQECLKFVLKIQAKFEGVPPDEELSKYVWAHLTAGNVIPGFGHAVLRYHDPRYTALFDLGKEYCPDNPIFQISERLGEIVPPLLKKQGKAKNPYPNIDGISGALLHHFGMKELRYYTVMFSTAQILGICAQIIMNRAVYSPIVRPKSVTTRWLQGHVSDGIS